MQINEFKISTAWFGTPRQFGPSLQKITFESK
jgi:hypothetical protein